MQALARAKINLCLEVLGRRSDGYHDIATVLHSIDLADHLTIEMTDDLTVSCQPSVVGDNDNLAMRAALQLKACTGTQQGAAIHLKKSIPVAAGLGGGSSDAAAMLQALNELWGLRLSNQQLIEVAATLGSDVPFFLEGGCALAEGRGEVLTPLPPMDGWWAVVLHPDIYVESKTSRLYGLLRSQDCTDGSAARSLARKARHECLSVRDVAEAPNAFERVEAQAFSGSSAYRSAFKAAGASFVKLSGSGPSLFTLVEAQAEGETIASRLREWGFQAYLGKLVGKGSAALPLKRTS